MEDDENRQKSVLKPDFLETLGKNYEEMADTFHELQNKLADFVARILVTEFQLTNVRTETNVLEEENRDLEYSVRNLKQKYEKNEEVVIELRREITPLREELVDCHRTTEELSTSLALVKHELNIVRMHAQARLSSHFLAQDEAAKKKSSTHPEEAESSEGATKRRKTVQDSQKKSEETHDNDSENSSVAERQQEAVPPSQETVNVLQQTTTMISVSGPSNSSQEPHEVDDPGNPSIEKKQDETAAGEQVNVELPQVPVSEEEETSIPDPGNSCVAERQQEAVPPSQETVNVLQQATTTISVSGPSSSSKEPHEVDDPGNSSIVKKQDGTAAGKEDNVELPQVPVSEEEEITIPEPPIRAAVAVSSHLSIPNGV